MRNVMKGLVKVLLALSAVVGTLGADEKPCTVHSGGKYYDLNPLKAIKDYDFKTPNGRLFALNVCRSPVTETFGLKDIKASEIGGFVRRDRNDFAIGALNTTLEVQGKNPRITMSEGSVCKYKSSDTSIRASTVIEFICDTSIFGTGKPRLVAQLPPGDEDDACAFVLEWRTHVACPTNEPGGALGFFSFLAILVISLLILYTVLGTLYNRFVLNLRGLDQLPQFTIEGMKYHLHEALDWIKDVASGMRERQRSGGFSGGPGSERGGFGSRDDGFGSEESGLSFPRGVGITSNRNSTTNPVSHQSQVSAAAGEGGGGFVRPQLPRSGSGGERRSDINPVSHQSRVQAITSPPSQGTPPTSLPLGGPPQQEKPQPPPPKKEKAQPPAFNLESTEQEREFMLGDDDEDEASGVPKTPSAGTGAGGSGEDNGAAALRGRDLGDGGVIRL
ncbi:mannose-6-phosphate receptor binding domain-containing protein [Collybia nuda]|uniref:Mannose-6-phosphate receptor binding domain-containing protein n=1 Tax=Collybia nuda TaxID=64659 RepID=A0A9P5XWF9_9AGAR|nr:mannose-6-phosphate receptor binding domain-containing protein [Collybia nuda]